VPELKVATTNGASTVLGEGAIRTFEASLRGELLHQGQAYEEARKIHNGMIDRRPALIVRCAGVADVMNAVKFARDNNLLVSVHGGGHGVPGFAVCNDGLMIDLSRMKSIHVDPIRRAARAEGVSHGESSIINHGVWAGDHGWRCPPDGDRGTHARGGPRLSHA
jgi:FAD binding domain